MTPVAGGQTRMEEGPGPQQAPNTPGDYLLCASASPPGSGATTPLPESRRQETL